MTKNKTIKLYGRQNCGGCQEAKKYLTDNGVEFEYCDLDESDNKKRIQFKKEIGNLGVESIPALIINGELVSEGFDEGEYGEIFKDIVVKKTIVKRNGDVVDFKKSAIERVVGLAMGETDENIKWQDYENMIDAICETIKDGDSVEQVSNTIERKMMEFGLYNTAKRYILYRAEREHNREKKSNYKYLSNKFLSKYKHLDPFKTEIGKFTYLRTYSRLLPEEKRREKYWETVARVVDFNIGLAKWKTDEQARIEAEMMFDNIFNLKQFPSGRAMFSAGEKPSYQNPISQYNCSFAVFDNFDILKDATYLLMLGVGFGFSVENQYVDLLPNVKGKLQIIHKSYSPIDRTMRKESTEFNIAGDIMEIVVGDSKLGWANAVDLFIKAHYLIDFRHVKTVIVNYNNVRPFNEPLKTFGGFASGHTALQTILEKMTKVLSRENENGKFLKPIDCMDLIDIIAEGIVVGGTRRSACATLISEDDKDTQNAKQKLYTQDGNGNWVIDQGIIHRQMSNNSTAFWSKPSYEDLKERFEIIRHSAENNFFNLESARKRKPNVKGTNPLT